MVRNHDTIWLVGILIGLSVITGGLVFLAIGRIFKIGGEYKTIEHVEGFNRVNLEYFVAYIIPFLTQDFLGWENTVSFGIVFFIIGLIYVKSDLIHVNPMLTLTGYNIFKVRIDGEERVIISRKKKILPEVTEEVIELGDNVLLGITSGGRNNRENRDISR